MRKTVALDLTITAELDEEISAISQEAGISREDVFRRGLAVIKAYKEQRELGRRHIGFVSDPRNLDAEVINVL